MLRPQSRQRLPCSPAFLHPAFDAHPVIGLRHQVSRVLDPVKCSLQRLRIGERLRTHLRRHLHGVEVERSPGKHAREAAARRFDLHGILKTPPPASVYAQGA